MNFQTSERPTKSILSEKWSPKSMLHNKGMPITTGVHWKQIVLAAELLLLWSFRTDLQKEIINVFQAIQVRSFKLAEGNLLELVV